MTAAALDWQAFTAAYFPGRHRHDMKAVAAYGAYRRSQRTGEGAGPVHADRTSATTSTQVQAWEDEGGAGGVPERSRSGERSTTSGNRSYGG